MVASAEQAPRTQNQAQRGADTSAGEMMVRGFRRPEAGPPDPDRLHALQTRLATQHLPQLFSAAMEAERVQGTAPLDRVTPEQTMRVAMRLMDLCAEVATEQAELRYLQEELAARSAQSERAADRSVH